MLFFKILAQACWLCTDRQLLQFNLTNICWEPDKQKHLDKISLSDTFEMLQKIHHHQSVMLGAPVNSFSHSKLFNLVLRCSLEHFQGFAENLLHWQIGRQSGSSRWSTHLQGISRTECKPRCTVKIILMAEKCVRNVSVCTVFVHGRVRSSWQGEDRKDFDEDRLHLSYTFSRKSVHLSSMSNPLTHVNKISCWFTSIYTTLLHIHILLVLSFSLHHIIFNCAHIHPWPLLCSSPRVLPVCMFVCFLFNCSCFCLFLFFKYS